MRVYRSVAHRFNRRDGSDGHRAKRHAWYMTTCSVALASAGGMWSDVVVLAVWLSVVEARGTLWPLWALGPHFSFNIYPCLPAPSRRKRPPLRQPRIITLGPLLVPLNNSWRSLSRPRFAVAGEAVAAWFARRVAILPPQG